MSCFGQAFRVVCLAAFDAGMQAIPRSFRNFFSTAETHMNRTDEFIQKDALLSLRSLVCQLY